MKSSGRILAWPLVGVLEAASAAASVAPAEEPPPAGDPIALKDYGPAPQLSNDVWLNSER